jgi:hypothetical protein
MTEKATHRRDFSAMPTCSVIMLGRERVALSRAWISERASNDCDVEALLDHP